MKKFLEWLKKLLGGGSQPKPWQLGVTVHPTEAIPTIFIKGGPGIDGVRQPGTAQFIFSIAPEFKNKDAKLATTANGFRPDEREINVGSTSKTLEDVFLTAFEQPPQLVPALIYGPENKFIHTPNGLDYVSISYSEFAAVRLTAEGQDITPLIKERAAMGFNEARVFSMMAGQLGHCVPTEIADYYTRVLPETLDKFEKAGLRVELTLLVDRNGCGWGQNECIAHVDQCLAVLASRPVQHKAELVNEQDQVINAIDQRWFDAIDWRGLPYSRGSWGADVIPSDPHGTYATLHPARPPVDWVRKTVHNPMEDIADRWKVPAFANEIKRPDEGATVSDYFEVGAGSSLLHCGSCFHTQAGKFGRSFDDYERQCGEAFVAGAKAVPLNYRYGQYTAGHLSEIPIEQNGCNRIYARILGNLAVVVTCVQPSGWVPVYRNGWRLRTKISDSVYEVER